MNACNKSNKWLINENVPRVENQKRKKASSLDYKLTPAVLLHS